MPSQEHERAAQLLGFFIPQKLADELEVDFEPMVYHVEEARDGRRGSNRINATTSGMRRRPGAG